MVALDLPARLYGSKLCNGKLGQNSLQKSFFIRFCPIFAPNMYGMSRNELELRGTETCLKAKSRAVFGTVRDLLKKCDGGGGGNRTPVREHSTQSFYRFRSGLNLISDIAPNQAVCDQLIVSSRATSRRAQTFTSLIMCRLPGLSGIVRLDVTAEAIRCPTD